MQKKAWAVGIALLLVGALSQYVGDIVAALGTLVAIFGLGIIFADLIDHTLSR